MVAHLLPSSSTFQCRVGNALFICVLVGKRATKYSMFTFGEMTFTFGEITFTFEEIRFTLGDSRRFGDFQTVFVAGFRVLGVCGSGGL